MIFKLYDIKGPRAVIDKYYSIHLSKTIDINLLNPFNINTTFIDVKDAIDIPNIAYISTTWNNKEYYYYIDNIELLNGGILRWYIQLDYLYTYKEKILKEELYIERANQFNNFTLKDELFLKNDEISIINDNTNPIINNNTNITLNPNNTYIVNIITNEVTSAQIGNSTINGLNGSMFAPPNKVNEQIYELTESQLKSLSQSVITNDNLKTFIKSIIKFPIYIDYARDNTGSAITIPFKVGNEDITGITNVPIAPNRYEYNLIADYDFTKLSSINFEDATRFGDSVITLYIVAYGSVQVNYLDCVGAHLLVNSMINLTTGEATIYITSVKGNTSRIIYTNTYQLGILLSLNSTNAYENNVQEKNGIWNTIASGVGAISSVAVAGLTGNPLGLLNATNQFVGMVTGTAKTANSIVDRASGGTIIGASTFVQYKKSDYTIAYKEIINYDMVVNNYGRLVMNFISLEDFSKAYFNIAPGQRLKEGNYTLTAENTILELLQNGVWTSYYDENDYPFT